MICDTLENSQIYAKLSPGLEKAFAFLNSNNLAVLEPGRMDLEGNSIYVMVQEYTSKPESEGKWEAHKRYIDVQYIISGTELIGFALLNTMKLGEYNPEKDFQAMTGSGQMLKLTAGDFAVFFPQDAHMPGLEDGERALVKKVVVKIAV